MYATHWIRAYTAKDKKRYLNAYCDVQYLSETISEVCNKYEAAGYQVVSVTPIIRGQTEFNQGAAYSYSVTDGVVILFKYGN